MNTIVNLSQARDNGALSRVDGSEFGLASPVRAATKEKTIKSPEWTWIAVSLVMLFLNVGSTSADNTNAPVKPDYSAFRIIAERNIFNPNRYARGSQPAKVANRVQLPASRIESLTLVGLMEFEKGTFAFFDGTSPGSQKTLQAGGQIAGCKLALVNSRMVKLVEGTNGFELRVGQQLRREDDSDWFVAEADGGSSRRRSTSRTGSNGRIYEGLVTGANGGGEVSPADATGEPEVIVMEADPNGGSVNGESGATAPVETDHTDDAGSEITDPVLRRLMERRQQEMNR